MLGAAVGCDTFCAGVVGRRRAKAGKLLQRLGELNDSQTGLLLMRSCASYAKLMHNVRTWPSPAMAEELQGFDSDVRSAFSSLTHLAPDDLQWARAVRATGVGGLGLRSVKEHADAAFLASVASSTPMQHAIWPALSLADVLAEPPVQAALTALAPMLPRSLALSLANGEAVPQKLLSRAIDRGAHDAELLSHDSPQHLKAHLQLVTAAGADGWLHNWPNRERDAIVDTELFNVSLARRLRMQLLSEPACCPCCGACLDVFMDHALVCGCGGDRTLRHNAARDALYADACEAIVMCRACL